MKKAGSREQGAGKTIGNRQLAKRVICENLRNLRKGKQWAIGNRQ